ncbi:MAG: alpha-amylase [Deltaproteobacteria bacterium]|nr:alpha-amylase [Deltaproteobacteria bacterium]
MSLVYPSLYQINTRVWLRELAETLGRPATLNDVPDYYLDGVAELGFDYVWFLGVWQTGPAGRAVSLSNPALLEECRRSLPDFKEEDVSGSPFAVRSYAVHEDFGGPQALENLRGRLALRGLRLILDFVPNHTAPDHPWVFSHPEYYVQGRSEDLRREPYNYRAVETGQGPLILAYGRDPYFSGWPDTFQLNYRHPGLRAAMAVELEKIAGLADGVRCDMAMLILPEIFDRTWGERSQPPDDSLPLDEPFWPEAIRRVKEKNPDFLFMAEVYWDLEWALMQQGFDYAYDKRLYDRLEAQAASAVRRHLLADPEYQRRSIRFLENHDEPRAAATFPPAVHQAAAVVAFFLPGLRFFHEGQLEGRRIKISMHLGRRPREPVAADLEEFYQWLLAVLKRAEVRSGRWRLLETCPAWEGNPTGEQFLCWAWEGTPDSRLLVAVNYGPLRGQTFVTWPFEPDGLFRLRDLLGPYRYEREGADLADRGLYLDMPEWGYHAFEVKSI